MVPPHRPLLPVGIAGLKCVLTDDGSRTLWSESVSETFHSGCGAVAESLVVYLVNSGVAHRLLQKQPTNVLEVGLGTGTDFLLTVAVAAHFRTPLVYTALETELLDCELLRNLHADVTWERARAYCESNGLASLVAAFEPNRSILDAFCDAMRTATSQCENEPPGGSVYQFGDLIQLRILRLDVNFFSAAAYGMFERNHAVFFDPFSPQSAPELWTDSTFQRVSEALELGGTLTTYCVKGSVRRQLNSLGFQVGKRPGPAGGKREVLVATKVRS